MKRKIKLMVYSLLSIFFLATAVIQPVQTQTVKADPVQWIFCSLGDPGENILKAARTDWIPYLLFSKSVTQSEDSIDNIYNSILNVSGYHIGADDASNPFDRFGLAGLKYVSYTGEWKYYDVDVCDSGDEQIPQSTNYGEFYDGRKDPLSTYEEVTSTTDPRTKEYSKTRANAIGKAFSDNFANIALGISKLWVSLLLALLSLSMRDISSMFGLTKTVQETIVTRLYTGLFLPLASVFMLFTAGYILYKGVFKREYRETVIGGIIKPIACFVGAVIIGTSPSLVAIPGKIAVATQALVVSGLSSSLPTDGSYDLCKTSAKKVSYDLLSDDQEFLSSQTDYMKSVLGCRIWSEFLFKPYVKGQFGTDYANLDSEKVENVNHEWVGNPSVLLLDNKIANWGLFHVSVMSGNHKPNDGVISPNVGGVNKDYFRIVDALSNYEEDVIQTESVNSNNSSSSGSISVGGEDWLKPGTTANRIASALWTTLTEKYGLSGQSAAGILGNIAQESHFNPSIVEAENNQNYSARGYGLYQFTPGTKYLNSSYYKPGASIEEEVENQTAFVFDSEFRNGTFNAYLPNCHSWFGFNCNIGTLLGSNNAEEATLAFFAVYERGDIAFMHREYRVASASKALEAYSGEHIQADSTKWPINGQSLIPQYGNSSGIPTIGLTGPTTEVPVQRETTPTEYWQYWVGNHQGIRHGQAWIMVSFSIIGSIAPLFFAFMSTILGLGLTVISMLSPVFLLFGCWGGKGNAILKRYLSTLLGIFLKRIGATVLLVISIVLVTNAMNMVNELGYIQSLIMLIVLTSIFVTQRKKMLNKFQQAVGSDQFDTNNATKGIKPVRDTIGATANLVSSVGVGAIMSKKAGGKTLDGAKAAAKENMRNQMYKNTLTRRGMLVHETISKTKEAEEIGANRCCVECGVHLNENSLVYSDNDNNYYCDFCASVQGYDGMSPVVIDNVDNEAVNTTRDTTTVVIENKDGSKQRVKHATYNSLNQKYGISDGKQETWNKNRKRIINDIHNSMKVVDYDMNRIDNSLGEHLGDYFIPEPLRSIIKPSDMSDIVKKNDKDGYKKIMQNAWEIWLRKEEMKRGFSKKDIEEHVELLRERLEV